MEIPHVETLAIGDELLTGRTTDTNSTFVGDLLFESGIRLGGCRVIPDEEDKILESLRWAAERCEALVVFGGLGPTSDDRTVETVAKLLDCGSVAFEPAKLKLERYYQRAGRVITDVSLRQVYYPEKTTPIPNPEGLAPGFQVDFGKCRFYFLPGVPREMKRMVRESVLPDLKQRVLGPEAANVHSQMFKLLGIPESEVQDRMNDLERRLPEHLWVGYRTHYPENHLSLYGKFKQGSDLSEYERFLSEIEVLFADKIFAKGTEALLEGEVVAELRKRRQSIALVESCTVGLTTQRLGRISGASDVLWGGLVTYQHQAKNQVLGLSINSLAEAVGMETSRELADQLSKISGTPWGAAVTGYMEPNELTGGGCRVYYVVWGPRGRKEHELNLPSYHSRYDCQWGASSYLLWEILKEIKKTPAT